MEFITWRELAAAFVRVQAKAAGWSVVGECIAQSGSMYLKLRHASSGVRARVRLSHHRGRRRPSSEFSVVQARCGRFAELHQFLNDRLCGGGYFSPRNAITIG